MSQKNFHDDKLSRSISIRTRHFELLKRHRFYSFLMELMMFLAYKTQGFASDNISVGNIFRKSVQKTLFCIGMIG